MIDFISAVKYFDNVVYLRLNRRQYLYHYHQYWSFNVYNIMSKKQADSTKSPSKSGAKLQIKKQKKEKDKSIQKQLKIVAEEKSPKQKDNKQKEEKKQQKEVKETKETKEEKKDKDKKDKVKNNKDNKTQEKGQEIPLKKSQSKQNQKDQKQSKDKKKEKDKDKNKEKEKDKDKDEKKKDKDKKQTKQSPAVAKGQNPKSKNQVSLLSKNLDKELDTIQSIHKSQDKAKVTIQDLIKQYKSAAEAMLFKNHGHDPQKEREIQKHLQILQKQKENRRKKIEELDKQKQEIVFTKEKQKETKNQLRYQKMRENKIKKIQQKLSNISISAEQRRKQYIKFLQYVEQRRKFQPRFKKYEKEFQQGLQQEEQSYRQRLQQIVKKYQPMNKNELDHFQENYSLQKQQTENYRANKIKLEQDIIKEENERIRSKLWKGQCHKNVNQEMQLLLEKKKKPKQKLQAMKEYGKIAIQFIGKEEKQQSPLQTEDKEDENKLNQNVQYHQKYFKGVNYGLVPIQITTPLSIEEKNQLGRAYLDHVRERNLASINKSKTVDHGDSKKLDNSRQLKNRSQTFKVKRVSNPYYASPNNRKSLDFNNYESIEYSIEKIGSLSKQKKLQDQIIRYGQYGSILDIQQKKGKIGSLLVKQINDKLDLLNKL